MDKGRPWKRLGALTDYIVALNVPVYAAHAGYFIILSLFPMLVLLLSLLRYTGIPVHTFIQALTGVIPEALMQPAKRLIVTTYQNTSGMVISVSAITALWSASRGIYGLRKGLNAIYHVPETGGYFYTRSVSVVYTFFFLLLLILTLTLNIFASSLARYMPMLLFAAIFMALPNGRNGLWESLPGAALASAGWLGFSRLYTVYVKYFTGYASIYGAVYAVAVSMLWLYCCMSILLYGGALNYYLQSRRKRRH